MKHLFSVLTSVTLLAACGAAPPLAPDAMVDDVVADHSAPPPDAANGNATGATDAVATEAATTRDAVSIDVAVDDRSTLADASVVDAQRVDADAVDAPPADATTDNADVRDAAMVAAPPTLAFGQIYETILRPRCERCHGDSSSGSALQMPNASSAYRALVDMPVRTGWISVCDYTHRLDGRMVWRVRPRNPEASMLNFLHECYVRDAVHSHLTAEERAIVRAWIERGAPERES